MLQVAEAATAPGLGLRAAERAEVGDLGIFEYVSRSCATLGECIEAVCRYRRLMYDGATLELIVEGDRAKLRYGLQDRIATPVTFVEFALAACVVASRRALGFDGAPKVVRFVHDEPSYVGDYTRIFRAPLEFGAAENEVEFGKRALSFPLVTSDRAMLAILRRYADRLLEQLPTALPTARAVQALLRKRMDAGDASFDDVAAALHMSERTLRRRLTDEGVQLRTLIEETRIDQACRYLVSSNLSVSEIAYRVGFSHPPAFHRAFRRAQGESPLHYRRTRAQSSVYRYFAPPEDRAEDRIVDGIEGTTADGNLDATHVEPRRRQLAPA
jgi:AraC-like DNA-binding protein